MLGAMLSLVGRMGSGASPAVINNVTPPRGNDRGGTSVTLSGTGFTGTTSVPFGGVNLQSLVVVNDTTITGVTGAHARGQVNVVVNGPNGAGQLTNGFEYRDMLSTSNCLGWWRADLGVTSGGGLITQVNDQSGTGDANKHITASGALRPTLTTVDAAFNNRPVITFAGAQRLDTALPWASTLSVPFTIYVVARQPTATDAQMILSNRNGTGAFVRLRNNVGSGGPNGSLNIYNGSADAFTTAGGLDFTSARVAAVVFESGGSGPGTAYVNRYNTSFCSGANVGLGSLTGVTIGGNPGGVDFLIGAVAEAAVLLGAHDAATRQLVMEYLGDAYAISIAA